MSKPPFLPVPLQPRIDGWTPQRQWKFIETLSITASVVQAARSVGMSARSAHRLRQHPEAGEFRAAWDAAMRQVWGQLEALALDRAFNGEREIIQHDGGGLTERHRPCSDRLMMFLLASRERALAAERAERAAAHQRALAEARLAAIRATAAANAFANAAAAARRRGAAVPAPPPAPAPLPEPVSDAAAATAALVEWRGHAIAFTGWPSMDEPPYPADPDADPVLAPADGRICQFTEQARDTAALWSAGPRLSIAEIAAAEAGPAGRTRKRRTPPKV